jgi:hypothetical protein
VDEEVGRWSCVKCERLIVAAGPRSKAFKGTGAFIGACPWDCGAWISRAFRMVKPGSVRAFRAEEWDGRAQTGLNA